MRTWLLDAADEGRTVASLLRNLLPAAPRSLLRKLARDGLAVNGAPADPAARLRAGDRVVLRESGRVLDLAAGGPAPVDVLYDDEDLIAVNKPAGQAVHATGDADGRDLLAAAAGLARGLGHRGDYHAVNRIDRSTSGIVLLAPGSGRTAALARLFEDRAVDKRYLALVAGLPGDAGVQDGDVDGRAARTAWRVLARGTGAALVLAVPETGRKHQVRVHLAGAGHPLLGDRRYGGPASADRAGALLHAVAIAFAHPGTGEALDVVAPLPADFRAAARDAGIALAGWLEPVAGPFPDPRA